ncbi:MAG: efflux RND transporter permease subunit [Myxococcota bacterium]
MSGMWLFLGCVLSTTFEEPRPQPPPNLQIVIEVPGADAEEVETRVSLPVEARVQSLPRITHVSSRSQLGMSVVEASFSNGVSLEAAYTAIGSVVRDMPTVAADTATPRVRKAEPDDDTLRLMLQSDDLGALSRLSDELEARLRTLPGVSQVHGTMEMTPSLEMEVDGEQAATFGLSVADINNQLGRHIAAINPDAPLEDIGAISLETAQGTPLPLREVVRLEKAMTPNQLDRYDGQRVAWVMVKTVDPAAVRQADWTDLAERYKAKIVVSSSTIQ